MITGVDMGFSYSPTRRQIDRAGSADDGRRSTGAQLPTLPAASS